MHITSQMLQDAFCQAQREILDVGASDHSKSERYIRRWERFAELLNEKLSCEPELFEMHARSVKEVQGER